MHIRSLQFIGKCSLLMDYLGSFYNFLLHMSRGFLRWRFWVRSLLCTDSQFFSLCSGSHTIYREICLWVLDITQETLLYKAVMHKRNRIIHMGNLKKETSDLRRSEMICFAYLWLRHPLSNVFGLSSYCWAIGSHKNTSNTKYFICM